MLAEVVSVMRMRLPSLVLMLRVKRGWIGVKLSREKRDAKRVGERGWGGERVGKGVGKGRHVRRLLF